MDSPTTLPDFIALANDMKNKFNRHRLPQTLDDALVMIMDLEHRLNDTSARCSIALRENQKLIKQRNAARRLANKHRRRAKKLVNP